MSNDAPEVTGNRAARRAAARRGRKLTALGSGAVLATGVAARAMAAFAPAAGAVPIVVQNTNDSGAGSLREALANANPGDTIDLTGLTGTITLTSGELEVEDAVTIQGPGRVGARHLGQQRQPRLLHAHRSLGRHVHHLRPHDHRRQRRPGGGVYFDCDEGAATSSSPTPSSPATRPTNSAAGCTSTGATTAAA